MSTVDPRLARHREVWQGKPALRAIYRDFYREIRQVCAPGPTLEIGAGPGGLKSFADDIVATDILHAPWLDVVADAGRLPFADASFGNLVMIDVLHHVACVRAFLAESQRVLRPGGRIVVIEPAVTPLSWLFYRFFHDEDLCFRADPLAPCAPSPGRDPYTGNQAIPTRLFGRDAERLAREFPRLRIVTKRRLSLFAYPLSGGFRPWTLVPERLVEMLLGAERLLLPWIGAAMAFRMFVVLERHE